MAASNSKLDAQKRTVAQTSAPSEKAMSVIHPSHGAPPTELHRNRHTIFGKDDVTNLSQKASDIARAHVLTAGPLEMLEKKVRENPNVLLPTIRITTSDNVCLEGTLEQLATMLLDNTIKTASGIVHEGVSERLRRLRKELLPDTVPKALEQAKCASSVEKREEKEAKERQLLNDLFDKIKDNKSEVNVEIKAYIESIKPDVINNNSYYLNLLHLHNEAFAVIAAKNLRNPASELTTQAFQFGYKVIATIQEAFPHRLRQLLNYGVSRLLYEDNIRIIRKIDDDERDFLGGHCPDPEFPDRTNWRLGVNHFYNSGGGNPHNTYGDCPFPGMIFNENAVNAFNTLFQIIKSAAIQLSNDMEIKSNYDTGNAAIAAASEARRRSMPSCRH